MKIEKVEKILRKYLNNGSDRIDVTTVLALIQQCKKDTKEQLNLTDVDNCPFEAYATFCIECDRKGIKPIKHKDYLNLG